MGWAAGEVIDEKYRLERVLGQGAMGTVWRAMHLKLEQPVALKVLDVRGPRAALAVDQFLREARVAAAVRHRNVVYVSDYGETPDGSPYLAMELLQGQTLFERLLTGPTLRVGELVRIAEGCLNGLGAVHDAGIFHRDLKPQNVFLVRDADGEYPKLLDFGLSRATDPEGHVVTRDGAIVGTLAYMAPEQARGLRDVDRRADLYSIGAMLYEALTGEPPFTAATAADLLVAVLNEEIVPLVVARPELGRPTSDVLSRALAREKEQRFGSAREMRDALVAALELTPAAAELALPETFEQLSTHASSLRPSSEAVASSAPGPLAGAPPSRLSPSRARAVSARALAALVLPIALGGIAWIAWAAAHGTSTEAEAETPGAEAAPRAVRVELVGVPEGAQVLVDGQVVDAAAPIEIDGDGRVRAIEVRAAGSIPWRIGHVALADARYEVVLEPAASGRDAGALRDEARAAFAAGRYEDAARAYEEATRASPGEAGLWAGLGAARMRASDAIGAVEAYRQSAALDPRNARYQIAVGRALATTGDREGARLAFESALAVEPGNAEAQAQLERL